MSEPSHPMPEIRALKAAIEQERTARAEAEGRLFGVSMVYGHREKLFRDVIDSARSKTHEIQERALGAGQYGKMSAGERLAEVVKELEFLRGSLFEAKP